MSPLHGDLRNQLGRVIQAARREAEAGARKALETLAVHRHEPHSSMTPKLLAQRTWHLVARLGPGAFETIGGHVVRVALSVISAGKPEKDLMMAGLDASGRRSPSEKAALLRGKAARPTGTSASNNAEPQVAGAPEEDPPDAEEAASAGDVAAPADGSVGRVLQAEQLKNPDARVSFAVAEGHALLSTLAGSFVGLQNNDSPKNLALFWEVSEVGSGWDLFQLTTETTTEFSGRSGIVRWPPLPEYLIKGTEAWGHDGVLVRHMSDLPVTLYSGQRYDQSSAAIIPADAAHLPAIWCFCVSPEFAKAIRRIDQALKVTNASLIKIPFELARWQKVAAEKYPSGLPEPESDNPTQWLFHGHLGKADPHAVLQVAAARLLGYRWPPEHDLEMRLATEARAWGDRCRELNSSADEDGIVGLTALRGKAAAVDRLRELLAAAFGNDWSAAKERELLAAAAGDGKPAASLDEWLRDRFFEEHCKLFHHRPFIWHIWDGRRDGFHALVNYHRLAAPAGEGRRTIEALAYSYLGDWIERQKAEQREGKEGADARLAAAQDLQAQLERILAGEPPCDLFVRWKPLREQPIGWEPDINDGVRLNIRPFLSAELRTGGRKGAGILRWRPNIDWKKDRGKEPQSLRPKAEFPWFWRCPGEGSMEERTDFQGGSEFDGNRWNDLHYRNATKRAARERAGAGADRV